MNQLLRRGKRKGWASYNESHFKALRKMIMDMVLEEPLLADRLHNMRTVFVLKPEKQAAVAGETQEVWCTMAECLGWDALKSEMEDLCFAVMDPAKYCRLRSELDALWSLQTLSVVQEEAMRSSHPSLSIDSGYDSNEALPAEGATEAPPELTPSNWVQGASGAQDKVYSQVVVLEDPIEAREVEMSNIGMRIVGQAAEGSGRLGTASVAGRGSASLATVTCTEASTSGGVEPSVEVLGGRAMNGAPATENISTSTTTTSAPTSNTHHDASADISAVVSSSIVDVVTWSVDPQSPGSGVLVQPAPQEGGASSSSTGEKVYTGWSNMSASMQAGKDLLLEISNELASQAGGVSTPTANDSPGWSMTYAEAFKQSMIQLKRLQPTSNQQEEGGDSPPSTLEGLGSSRKATEGGLATDPAARSASSASTSYSRVAPPSGVEMGTGSSPRYDFHPATSVANPVPNLAQQAARGASALAALAAQLAPGGASKLKPPPPVTDEITLPVPNEGGLRPQVAYVLPVQQQRLQTMISTVVPFDSVNFKSTTTMASSTKKGLKVLEECASQLYYEIQNRSFGMGLDVLVYDCRALRVIVDDEGGNQHQHAVEAAYKLVSVVHSIWRAIPREFDDYIANPKPSGYQALHTAVRGPGGIAMEIQIKTLSMHELAEYGAAAHWVYKEFPLGVLPTMGSTPSRKPPPASAVSTQRELTRPGSLSTGGAASSGSTATAARLAPKVALEPVRGVRGYVGQPVLHISRDKLRYGVVLDRGSNELLIAIKAGPTFDGYPTRVPDYNFYHSLVKYTQEKGWGLQSGRGDFRLRLEEFVMAKDGSTPKRKGWGLLSGSGNFKLRLEEFVMAKDGRYHRCDHMGDLV
eukprot:gene16192-22355_t